MLNIKLRLKIKQLKEKLISGWYFLMKPLAFIFTKYDNYKHKKERNKMEINWSDEQAIKLYSKIFIKNLIKDESNYAEFIVADYGKEDYNLYTIREFMIHQKYNKKLQYWVYKIPLTNSVDRIEKLTELLRQELVKYKEIKCEYFVDKNIFEYMAGNYKKTLRIELNDK